MNRIKQVEDEIEALRSSLRTHELYNTLSKLDDIKVFMVNHVFAVWDFMSLLKALQVQFTTLNIPWVPSRNPMLCRFVNDIVLAEESDMNELGEPKSHFEMYLDSMKQMGCDTSRIDEFLQLVSQGNSVPSSLERVEIDASIKEFVEFTFSVINMQKAHLIAAVFAFGREVLVPDMFAAILDRVDPLNKSYTKLRYYLDRHIELDGEDHGPLALKLVAECCGDDDEKWIEVIEVSKQALSKRLILWEFIEDKICNSRSDLQPQSS